MAAILDENQSFQGIDGKPVVDGKIYIGETNSDTKNNLINIFSDRELTTPLDNPQSTNSFGKAVNKIWAPSKFSIVVEDVNEVEVFNDQDAGGFASSVGTLILSEVVGIDTLTSSADPNITEYVNQQQYSFKAANNNTGAVTMNVDGNGAIPIKNEGADLTAGRLVDGTIYIIIFNSDGPIFQLASSSGGDVSGPGIAVDANIALFDGVTGKLIKDSGLGIVGLGDVDGPGSATSGNFAIFNGASGKIIADSGLSPSDFGDASGPGSSVIDRIATFSDTSGKLLKDSGVLVTNLVKGPVVAVDNNVAVYDSTTGKIIKDSGILATGLVTGPAISVIDRIATFTDTSGKLIKDSGILISSLGDVSGPGSSGNNSLASFDGVTGKLIKDSGVLVSTVVTATSTTNFTNKTYNAKAGGNDLSNIDLGNCIEASQAEAEAGVEETKLLSSLRVAQAIAAQTGNTGVVKTQISTFSSWSSTTSLIPTDDTIPQSSEGTEFMTIAYTPLFSDSKLRIEAAFFCANNISENENQTIGNIICLFKDSIANALNVAWLFGQFDEANNSAEASLIYDVINISFEENAVNTSARTYKLRGGIIISGSTLHFNGQTPGNRQFGATPKSWIRVTEIKA